MIIGTFWYFNFPSEFYNFEYFKFKKGFSGYAESEAALIANIEVVDPKLITLRLQKLIETYDEGSIYIYEGKNQIIIGTESYTLFDYDFLFISEIEKILKEENAKISSAEIEKYNHYYLFNETYQNSIHKWKGRFLQLERNNLKNNSGDNIKIRLNCNLNSNNKYSFIADLKTLCGEHHIEALYYFEKITGYTSTLIIFFCNGRQGVGLRPKKDINTTIFEEKVESIMRKHLVNTGHVEGLQFYPDSNPIIELMTDHDFII
jgi:hypothetical protein